MKRVPINRVRRGEHYPREADLIPRPPRGCFDWRPFEIVYGQPKPPLPPTEMKKRKSDG